MHTDVINAFLKSTKSVIETMAKVEPRAAAPKVRTDNRTSGIVSGLIGLAGPALNGNMLLSFDQEAILAIVSSMFGEEFEEVNDDVVDAVGELTNVISGAAKVELGKRGYQFEMAIPVTIVGQNVEISQISRTTVIQIPFSLAKGSFTVDCQLEKRVEK